MVVADESETSEKQNDDARSEGIHLNGVAYC